MRTYTLSTRLSQEEQAILHDLEHSTGLQRSQIIRQLILGHKPAPLVDHSREILPHLCRILTITEQLCLPEANEIRQEVNELCRLLSS